MMFGMAGKYQFEKFEADAEGNEIPGTRSVVLPWFDNLITNVGLDMLGATGGVTDSLNACRVGTGSTTPAFTDTGLVSQTGGTITSAAADESGIVTTGTPYVWRRVRRRFAAGTVSGVNLTEVAMAPLVTGNVFSRALLTDSGGTPTTITLSSIEVLDVVYELRCYINVTESTGTFTIDGVSTTVTIRAHQFPTSYLWASMATSLGRPFTPRIDSGNSTEGIQALETQPAAGVGPSGTGTYTGTRLPYVTGTYTSSVRWDGGLSVGNFVTGVGAVSFTGESNRPFGLYSFGFNPKLNKTASRTAVVTISMTWGRYTP